MKCAMELYQKYVCIYVLFLNHMSQGLNSFIAGDIPPSMGNPYNRYVNSYYRVDHHPRPQGTYGSLDPNTYHHMVY